MSLNLILHLQSHLPILIDIHQNGLPILRAIDSLRFTDLRLA